MDAYENAYNLLKRSDQSLDLGRYPQAAEFATQAIALIPDEPDGYQALARALICLNKPQEAEMQVRRALELDPTDAWTYLALGSVLRLQKKNHEALRMIEASLQIDPQNASSLVELARCQRALKQSKKAGESLRKAVEIEPDATFTLNALANFYLASKAYTQAEKVYRQSLSLEPNQAEVLNNLGVCLENQDKLKEASLAYKSAMVLDPTLKVAKENTERSIETILGGGALGLTLCIFVGAKTIQLIGRNFGRGVAATVTCVTLIVALAVGVWYYNRRQVKNAETQLTELDPQLLEIYDRLKKHG